LAAIGTFTSFVSAHAWANASAEGLRAAEHPDGITRVVIDLSQSINFTTRVTDNPYRIIIDTETLNWSTKPVVTKATGPIVGVAYGEDNPGAHLTLKLSRPADVKSAFLIAPRDNNGWRFVIDIKGVTKQEFMAEAHPKAPPHLAEPLPLPPTPQPKPVMAEMSAPIQAAAPVSPTASNPIIISSPALVSQPAALAPIEPTPVVTQTSKGSAKLTAPLPPPPPPPPQTVAAEERTSVAAIAPTQMQEPLEKSRSAKERKTDKDNRQLVVIDPGHGGVDPGAIGVSGIYEKYITYSMAKELQQQLEKTGHYRVHLTRDRDVFIPLRERTAIARQLNADLFISLHADVVKDPDIRGLSVYTLSQNASDAEAQALADKENKSDLIAGIDLSRESSDVTNILIDLAQRETMNRSAGFASSIVDELGRDTALLANTHRFAGFAVLKSPDVPAVLIEMGYLSNTIDEKNLRQPEYRAKLAHAISRAVERYFLQGQKAKRP
jgi:N-acetylmuramoyl-L-alanine amidase